MKQVGDRADLADRLLQHLLELTECRPRRFRQRLLDAAGDQGRGNEVLAGAVVEIAGDAPPLLVLRPHDRGSDVAGRPFGSP